MIGVQIGVYRVVRQIGEGGMGAVWLAEHVMLGRPVAIKVLHREASLRPELVHRFFNEAKAATAISDPGIIQIFDFGHHTDGNAYIVMELLEGEPLDHRLRRLGRLPPAGALRIARQVASSLGAAHRRGIVHRDLKPENIFLVKDAEVMGGERTKVLDFGIAKLTTDQGVKTHTSAVMGTPIFMSPEQCRGAGQVDHRSDLYSLGCVLFTLLTGRPPFDADGPGEIIAMHLREPPPAPSSVLPGLPLELDALVLRCLAKDRDKRFESGAELAAAIEALIEKHGEQLGAAPARRASTEADAPTVPRPPISPMSGAPAAPVPRIAQPQAVPIVPLQPRIGPAGHVAQVAQAVTLTPVPDAPFVTPWPGQGGPHEMPRAGSESGGSGWGQPLDIGPTAPMERLELPELHAGPQRPAPRAATGEEPTRPYTPPSSMVGASSGAISGSIAVATPPVTLETVAAPGMGGMGRRSHAGHSGLTTLSTSTASGPVIKRKRQQRWWLIGGFAVVGGIVAVSLASRGTGPAASGDAGSELAAADSGAPEILDAGERVAAPVDAAGSATAPPPDAAAVAVAPVAPDAAAVAVAPIDADVAKPAIDAAPTVPVEPPKPSAAELRLRTFDHMRAVSTAFSGWAKANEGKPCPDIGALGLLLDPADGKDGWGTSFRITCTDQPSGQRIGLVSAGPDLRFESADDVHSWKVAVGASMRGLRWGVQPSTDKPSTKQIDKTKASKTTKPKSGKIVDLDGDGIPDVR